MTQAEHSGGSARRRYALREDIRRNRPELVVAMPFMFVFLLGICVGLPLSMPNEESLSFVERHYFAPFLAAIVIQGGVLAVRSKSKRSRLDLATLGSLLFLVGVTILIHFNFKAWMPLVHNVRFDEELAVTDAVLGPLVSSCIALRRAIAVSAMTKLGWNVDSLYHSLFVGMFFVAFGAHAAFDTPIGLRRVVLGACLIMLIGGLSYWVLPAKGPFVARAVENHAAADAQAAMNAMFDTIVATPDAEWLLRSTASSNAQLAYRPCGLLLHCGPTTIALAWPSLLSGTRLDSDRSRGKRVALCA